MATQVQIRRGTTSQHSTFTGAVAEITFDTDKNTVVVHNGSTAGGFPLAKETILTSSYAVANAAFGVANNAATATNASAAFAKANAALANADVVLAGNLTSTQSVADNKGDLRNLPINNQTSSYILTLADNGKVLSLTTGNVFITANVFYAGNTISVFNNSAANLTITQNTSVTLYSAGTANTGNRILQQRGIATIVCVAANTFVVTGAGMVP